MLVPVVDSQGLALEPCLPCKARSLVRRGKATLFRKKGFLALRLHKEVSEPNVYGCVLGIDPGTKRTGYTVTTKNKVELQKVTYPCIA